MRIAFIILLLCGNIISSAQPKADIHNTHNGKYNITYYSNNIIKLTYQPKAYTKNENVSDAVILKPSAKNKIQIEVKNGAANIGNRAILLNTDTSNGYNCFNFVLREGEMIFGGGERALPLNRRGYRFNLYNNPWYGYSEGADNLNYSVPFFTSNKGYALFFDNPSKGFVDIGKTDPNVFKAGFSSGELNVYVILGTSYQDILQSYHKLTGTQPLPPRWALGNLMSRFGYTSEAQARDILSKMKKEKIPVDAIIFDLFWFGDSIKGTLGNLDWVNKSKWPDPKKMINDFNKDGIKTLLVTEPFFVETSKNYLASKKYLAVDSTNKPYYLTDFYFGKGGLIDIFRKDSKDWFWQFYKKQMDMGVEAWWGDLGEPEKHPSDLYHNLRDLGQKRLIAADEVHNIYGHNWTKMLYEKYAKEFPNKRLFSLNRSGFAGSQRYSIFPWTGDVSRSWSGLRAQLPILLGMSMSGVPYVHSDAGGFAGGEGDNELYVRWLQFAAFTPIFRPHGTALYEVEKQAFSFPSEAALIDTPWRDYAKEAINLRYSMLPYNYSLSYNHTKYGKPLMAPLYYHFPNDTTAAKIQDQYMWGENILVAPILVKNVKTRKYYLPQGKWVNIEKGEFKLGNQWYEDSVDRSEIPFFAKEGSFIPHDFQLFWYSNTANTKDEFSFVLHIISQKPSSGLMYLDDGQSKNAFATNQYLLSHFNAKQLRNGDYQIQIQTSGNYQKARQAPLLFGIIGLLKSPKAVRINGKNIEHEWHKENNVLLVKCKNRNSTLIIKL